MFPADQARRNLQVLQADQVFLVSLMVRQDLLNLETLLLLRDHWPLGLLQIQPLQADQLIQQCPACQ